MFSSHTLYIRNRIVQWAFRPRIRNDGSRCTDVVLINHSDHDLRWNRCQQGDFRCRLFVSQDKQDENIQEHRKGSSRVYLDRFTHGASLRPGSHRQLQRIARLSAFRSRDNRQPRESAEDKELCPCHAHCHQNG